jgi:citrate lyase subunit beta/citryl-CoA lyase
MIHPHRGEAGRRGAQVGSDCWIAIEVRPDGPLEIRLRGEGGAAAESVRRQVEEGCAALGLKHAVVEVEDGGAAPFVLAARLETAVKRAWPDCRADLLPALAGHGEGGGPGGPGGNPRERLRRSCLYLPGNDPAALLDAGRHGPDAVVLDLEDAVAPAEKDAARILVRNALRTVDFRGAERAVRINQGDHGLADLEWIVPHHAHAVLIPRAEDPEQVVHVRDRIDFLRPAHLVETPVWLIPVIESARGAWRACEIAGAADTVAALAFHVEDYAAEIGAERTREGREAFWARSQVLNGARAAGVQPLDAAFADAADLEGLRRAAAEARALGFEGQACAHAAQVALLNDAYAPPPAAIERARRVVLAGEEAERQGLAAATLDGKVVDPPVLRRAQATVAAAVASGRLPVDWRGHGAGRRE